MAIHPAASLGNNVKKHMQGLNRLMKKFGWRLHRMYQSDDRGPDRAAAEFLMGIHNLRDAYKGYLEDKRLSVGSSTGAMLEWLFFHIIKEGIRARQDTAGSKRTVRNNHKIRFTRGPEEREKGRHKDKRVDISVWAGNQDLEKLLYCIEVKTNLDDGIFNYCKPDEYQYLHNPASGHPDFKYYFVALCDYEKIWNHEKHNERIERFNQKKEIFLFPQGSEKDPAVLDDAKLFLKNIYEPLG